MLTADLAISRRRGSSIQPRYLDANDAAYLQVAEDLIAIFRDHIGRRRAELDEELDAYQGTATDYKILRGLMKLLADRSTFDTATGVEPAALRRALFLKARAAHPLDEEKQRAVLNEAAAEFSMAPEQLTAQLYADLADNQRLVAFEELSARELIDRYNLAQAQALLYRAIEMRLKVAPQETAGYRRLFDAIKRYRLIHEVRGSAAEGYDVRLSGPVSMFHRSQKYGIQMAVFLPALLVCEGWSMRAEIDSKERGSLFFELDSRQTRLRADFLFIESGDNPFGEKLQARWDEGWGWVMRRSNEVIDLGEAAFVPDFAFENAAGRVVYLEILGFWTPRYLQERLREFERGGFRDFLLAASEDWRGSREAMTVTPAGVVLFKSSLDARDVRAALDKIAAQ